MAPRKSKRVAVSDSDEDDHDSSDGEELAENEFIVEKILAEKVRSDGEMVFLTKWEGYDYDECTWQTVDSFVDQTLINQWRRDKHKQEPFPWEEWDRRQAKRLEEEEAMSGRRQQGEQDSEEESSEMGEDGPENYLLDKKRRREQRADLAGFVVDDSFVEYSDDDDLDKVDRGLSGKKDKRKQSPRGGKRRSSTSKTVPNTKTSTKTKPAPLKAASNQPKLKSKVKEKPKSTGKLAPSVFSKPSSGAPSAPSRAAIPAKAPRNKLYHTSSHQYRANRKFGMEIAPDVSKLALSRPGIDPKPLISPADARKMVDSAALAALNKAKVTKENEDVEMEDASDAGYNSLFEDDGDITTTPATETPQLQSTTTATATPVDPGYTATYAATWDSLKQSPEPIGGKNSDAEWDSDGFGHDMTSKSLLVHFGNIAQRQSTYPELRYFTEDERVEIGTTKEKIEHILFWGPRMTRLGKISFTNVSEDFREFWSRYGEKGLWISKVLSLRYAHGEHQSDFGDPQEWFEIELENKNQWQPDVMASLRVANLNVALVLGPNWHILIFNAGLSNINRKFGLPHGTGSALRGLFWNVGWDMRNEPLSEEAEAFYKNPPLLETNDEELEWVVRQERGIDLDEILGARENPSETIYLTFVESTKASYSADSTNEIKKVVQLHKGVQLLDVEEVVNTGASLARTTNASNKPPAKFIIFVHWTHQFEMFRLSTLLKINQQIPNSRFYLYGLRPENLYPEPSKKLVGAVTPFWHEGITIFMTWSLARDHPQQVLRILAYAEISQNIRLLVPGDFIDILYESWAKKATATTWNTEIYSERAIDNASVELGIAQIQLIINEDKLRPDYQKVMNTIQLLNWCPEWDNQPPSFTQQLQLEMFDLHLLNSPLSTAKTFLFVDATDAAQRMRLQFPHIDIRTPFTIEDVSKDLVTTKEHNEFNTFVELHTKATTESPKATTRGGASVRCRRTRPLASGTK